jgi:hypothetical protein
MATNDFSTWKKEKMVSTTEDKPHFNLGEKDIEYILQLISDLRDHASHRSWCNPDKCSCRLDILLRDAVSAEEYLDGKTQILDLSGDE